MTTTPPRSLRTVVAAFAMLALLAGSAACSSSSETKADQKTENADGSTAAADSDSDSSGSTAELPDGFPDIPLPEYTSLEVQQDGNEDGTGIWSVNFDVVGLGDKSDAELADAYAEQLEGAGYEITPKEHGDNAYEATGNDIEFSYYVGAGQFLIQIIGS